MERRQFWDQLGRNDLTKKRSLDGLVAHIGGLDFDEAASFVEHLYGSAMGLAGDRFDLIGGLRDVSQTDQAFLLGATAQGWREYERLLTRKRATVVDFSDIYVEFERRVVAEVMRATGRPLDLEPLQRQEFWNRARVWARQAYSSEGLPPRVVAGWERAFARVEASQEIYDGLDAVECERMELLGEFTHDPSRGFELFDAKTRIRRARGKLAVDFAWDTARVRALSTEDHGARLVADLVDEVATRVPGMPQASRIEGLLSPR